MSSPSPSVATGRRTLLGSCWRLAGGAEGRRKNRDPVRVTDSSGSADIYKAARKGCYPFWISLFAFLLFFLLLLLLLFGRWTHSSVYTEIRQRLADFVDEGLRKQIAELRLSTYVAALTYASVVGIPLLRISHVACDEFRRFSAEEA